MKLTKGFTLVETTLVVAILSILLAIGTPNYLDSVERSKVNKAADLISQEINFAKSEALRRNAFIYITFPVGKICIGTSTTDTTKFCDLREDFIADSIVLDTKQSDGTTVETLSVVSFDGVTGSPKLDGAMIYGIFTVTSGASSKQVTINPIGIVTSEILS